MQPILDQGIDLMLYGMGTVFVFLTVLVCLTTLMSGLLTRFFPEQIKPSHASDSIARVDDRTLSILQSAIDQHRGRH